MCLFQRKQGFYYTGQPIKDAIEYLNPHQSPSNDSSDHHGTPNQWSFAKQKDNRLHSIWLF
jgi:hypothetical protein